MAASLAILRHGTDSRHRILIASERSGEPLDELLQRIQIVHGETEIAISAVSVVELAHGIYRARTLEMRNRRRMYVQGAFEELTVYPLTLEIAQLAGRIEGEQAAIGNVIAFEDLTIGATALHLGFRVMTLNVRHFERSPGLELVDM